MWLEQQKDIQDFSLIVENPQVENVTAQTQKLVTFFSEEWQAKVINIDIIIWLLLEIIWLEVKRRSKELNYNYEYNDYRRRLSIGKEVFDYILREKVLTWELKVLYEKLLSFGTSEIIINKLLYDYHLDDLVYESLKDWEYAKMELSRTIDVRDYTELIVNNNWNNLNWTKAIYFSMFDIWNLWEEELKIIFRKFRWIKCIDIIRK